VSVSGFKTNTFYRKLKYFMVFISCLLQEERMQKSDTDLSDSSSVIMSQHNYLKVSISSLLKVYIDHRTEKKVVLLLVTIQVWENKPSAFYHMQFKWFEVFQSPKTQT